MLNNYVNAMEYWKGRVDSTDDYDTFRWHQWVKPIDLNEYDKKFEGPLGFAFIGFCSEQGVKRNKGRTGTALAPDFIRGQMSNLPAVFHRKSSCLMQVISCVTKYLWKRGKSFWQRRFQ